MRAISFPFRIGTDGLVVQCPSYEDVVRSQVIDALMTNMGERVFRARYGCDVQSSLFDPTDELVRRDAAGMIRSRLEQLVPRCIVRDIAVDRVIPPGQWGVTILYRPSLFATDTTVTVPLASEFINRQNQLEVGE
jgi:phage baseplate assembly protein W